MYTPGPWEILREQTKLGNSMVIIAPDPHDPQPWYVAEIYEECGVVPEDEVGGNAQLIAAAPELLEALEAMQNAMVNRSTVEGDLPWTTDVVLVMTQTNNAIAKAKGKPSCNSNCHSEKTDPATT
jgi:hypothetical protein